MRWYIIEAILGAIIGFLFGGPLGAAAGGGATMLGINVRYLVQSLAKFVVNRLLTIAIIYETYDYCIGLGTKFAKTTKAIKNEINLSINNQESIGKHISIV